MFVMGCGMSMGRGGIKGEKREGRGFLDAVFTNCLLSYDGEVAR